MNVHRRVLGSAIALAIATSTGCGGSGGEQDSASNDANGIQSRALHARAVDGYLAGATAYVDHNENGRLDAFEPRAITDRDGFFSYNHLTGTDYCANSAAELAQHCLRGALAASAEVLIRVTGGYDTITGLPFKGTLSLRANELSRDARRLVTPQTSMISSAATAQASLDLLTKAGIVGSAGSLHADHVGGLLSAEAIRAQLSAFLVRMSVVAADLSSAEDSFEDLEADAWHMGYTAMAKQLASAHTAGSAGAFGEVFSSPAVLRQLVREVVHAHLHSGQPAPAGFALPNESAMSDLLQFSADLIALGEELIAAMQAGAVTSEQMNASLRVLALASERGLADALDPELADLFAWVRQQISPTSGLGADLAGLGAENVDLGVLIDRGFDFDPSSSSISARALIPAQAATAFAAVANTAFRGSVDKKDEQGDTLIFLMGDHGARSGSLKLCVRYRDDDGDFDTSSASDPDGALLVGGRWNLLNGHTLTLNVDIVGGTRPLIVKSVGVSGSDLDYRFDFGGDLSKWTGAAPAGFATGSVPADGAACRAALIQEFGVMN